MHQPDQRNTLIQALADGSTVSAACKRAGVSRMLFYRLLDGNQSFRKAVEKAQREGKMTNDDVAVTAHHKLIRKEHWQAIRYHLEHNVSPYKEAKEQRKQQHVGDDELKKELAEFLGRHKPIDAPTLDQIETSLRAFGWTTEKFAKVYENVERERKEKKAAQIRLLLALEDASSEKSKRRHTNRLRRIGGEGESAGSAGNTSPDSSQ